MKRLKRKLVSSSYTKSLSTEERVLYKKAIKQVEEVNRRLNKLSKGIDINKSVYNPKTKRYERKNNIIILENGVKKRIKTTNYLRYESGTWASKKLFNRLEKYYSKKSNKIIITKDLDSAELRNIIKATNKFISSQTSTIKGIKKVEETTKETISNIVEDVDKVTREDIETLYVFWNDSDFIDITQYIPPSDLYIILAEADSNGYSDDQFLRKIEMYIDKGSLQGDSDMRDKLIRIYHKYIG